MAVRGVEPLSVLYEGTALPLSYTAKNFLPDMSEGCKPYCHEGDALTIELHWQKLGKLYLKFPPQKKPRLLEAGLFVAGAGVEPTSGDYEPPEIPFLYPASSQTRLPRLTWRRFCVGLF